MLRFIDNQGITDPRVNLAVEEYALRHLPADDDYLLFYINEPSIIIGKNQNTAEEINAEYVRERGIHVVRRLSGGGAVYHDLGNLNYSFITKDDGQSFHNYRKFTEPVIRALREMGVEAELTGRNDIQVGSRKISGNAQFATKGRMYTHGTLLFASEMEHIVSALHVDPDKIQSKGVKSIRARVANISEFLPERLTIKAFRERLLHSIFANSDVPVYKLDEQDWEQIRAISAERYGNWDWNYGRSPAADFKKKKRIEGIGTIDVRLKVSKGVMEEVRIFGDFFGTADVAELERKLTGIRHDWDSVREVLSQTELKLYFGPVEQEDVLSLFF